MNSRGLRRTKRYNKPQPYYLRPFPDPDMSLASPCINICRMNAQTGLCEGCFRTLDEIARWSRMGEGAQRHVLDLVARRRVASPDGHAAVAGGAQTEAP